jgi:hypothetical protein
VTVKGEIKMNGKVIGKILDVAYRGEHGKIPDCETVEIPPFISGELAVEMTFTRTWSNDELLRALIQGRRSGKTGLL